MSKVTLYNHKDAYDVTQTTEETPSQTTKIVTHSAPDEATQQFVQEKVLDPLAQAHGVDPSTGKVTPFEVLGYNPEEERARREKERQINDAKRKENAWFQALALVGDSLTTALGGNVWKRTPSTIGAQAKADNDRLIAEQKAEDMNNQHIIRNAGAQYANMANKLIQDYLTKTTTTTSTGGTKTTTTHHPEENGYRQERVPDKDGCGKGGSGGSGSSNDWVMNINTMNPDGSISKKGYPLREQEFKAISSLLLTHYNRSLNQRNEDGELTQAAEDLRKKLLAAGVLKRTVEGSSSDIEQNDYVENMLLQNGEFWDMDDALMSRIESASGHKVKFKRKSTKNSKVWEGISPSSQNNEEEYDD